MSDVARLAGVSTATVSRALQDDPTVKAETRARVRRVSLEVGYVMHRQARALRAKRAGTIAVHVPIAEPGPLGVMSNPFVLEFLAAVGTSLHRSQLDMLVSHSASVDVSLYRSRLVDGYVQLGHGVDDRELTRFAEAGVPVVVWTPPSPDRRYCSVGVDNVALAKEAVAHLLGLGRRRIGIISGDVEQSRSEGRLRYDGYRSAMDEAGIEMDQRLIASADHRENSGREAIRRLLDQAPDVDAVFVAYSDVVALGVQRELLDLGRVVPTDIAVVGFDNIQMSGYATPSLTTVDQGLTAGVPVLIDMLIRQVEGRAFESQFVEGSLVVRESCGARAANSARGGGSADPVAPANDLSS